MSICIFSYQKHPLCLCIPTTFFKSQELFHQCLQPSFCFLSLLSIITFLYTVTCFPCASIPMLNIVAFLTILSFMKCSKCFFHSPFTPYYLQELHLSSLPFSLLISLQKNLFSLKFSSSFFHITTGGVSEHHSAKGDVGECHNTTGGTGECHNAKGDSGECHNTTSGMGECHNDKGDSAL